MPVTSDIVKTWRAPRRVVSEILAQGPREDRAIAWLMVSCGLIFVAQWPRLTRESLETGDELSRLVAYEALGWIFVWPLLFYGIAAVSWLLLRLVRVRISAFAARTALFWAFLSAVPAGLLYGLQSGLNGSGPATQLVGAIWLGAILVFWVQGLRAAAAARTV